MKIKVFGTGTSGHQVVISTLKKYLNQAQMDYTLIEETDVNAFIQNKVSSVPAIQIDDALPYSIAIDKSFNRSLREFVKKILRENNYGQIPKLIVPIDFSDTATNAFYYGLRMASTLGAVVKVLHAYKPSSLDVDSTFGSEINQKKTKEIQLNDFVKEADQDWSSDLMQTAIVESEFRMGFPGDEILKSAQENIPCLIVMGTQHNISPMKSMFGSVSTKVINHSCCPVLIVPETARYKGISNILYATEDVNLDMDCIKKLMEFIKPFNAHIHLIHVAKEGSKDHEPINKTILESSYPKSSFTCETITGQDIAISLMDYAQEKDIELHVLVHKKRNFIQEIFHKSTTVVMSTISAIPILIIPSPEHHLD